VNGPLDSKPLLNFDEVYRAYAPGLYRFATRLCRDPEEGKDLVSEAFLRAWTSGDSLRIDTVRAYLFAIVRNLHLHRLRRSSKEAGWGERLDETLAAAGSSPLELSEADEVRREIARLPEADRTALILRVDEDLSYEEIGQILGISAGAARVKVHRAKLRVARTISGEEARR
jgi:RNA polymerase sigma factor (sigma-70 family)